MLILVINCGSSSAKYQLFDIGKNRSLARGIIERIGQGGMAKDHYLAISIIIDTLTDRRHGVIKSKLEIDGVGHRVVHGGEKFKASTLITRKVIKSIEDYSELAPLHNPPSLLGINASFKILKNIPQAAVFDTSFHQTMPAKAYIYGLPFKYYGKYGIRKYGFHGTSHRYVAEEAGRKFGKPLSRLKLITCHLGNGCSMAAIDGGVSVDTSMGFTPLEGLLMGTRSGDIDPAAVLYIMEKEGMTPSRINDMLNKESGLLGISGISNDMRDLTKAIKNNRARLAIEIFIYRIKKYIGAYQAAMGGLDAVIFTAGISENNPWLVKRVAKELKRVVSGKVKFLVIPTNEELLIAKDTYSIIKKGRI